MDQVYFRDDDVPTFMVVAKGSDVIEMKKKAGDLAGSRQLADCKDLAVSPVVLQGCSKRGIHLRTREERRCG